jgi:hypothetical protein
MINYKNINKTINKIFNVDINSIKYYKRNKKILPIENHEMIIINNYFIDNQINIQDCNISDILDYINNTSKDINNELFDSFIKNKNNFEVLYKKYKDLYVSILNNGYNNTIVDPIKLYRIKKNSHENILCLHDGKLRFFICKFLNIKTINAFIEDSILEKNYIIN